MELYTVSPPHSMKNKLDHMSAAHNNSIRILGVAFEPWETEIAAATIQKLREVTLVSESALLITDIWQIRCHNAIKNLERIKKEYEISVYSLEEEFLYWQSERFIGLEGNLQIYNWAIKNDLDRSTRIVSVSDHIFSCYERSPFYKTLSPYEKESIFYSQCAKICNIIDEFQPNLIFCIERNYLGKNIVASLAKSKDIHMETLIFSRIKNYYYFNDNFAMCSSSKLFKRVKEISEVPLERAIHFLEEREQEGKKIQPLYSGMTEDCLDRLAYAQEHPMRRVISEGIITAYDLCKRLRERDSWFLPNSNKRYASVWWRAWIYVLMNYLRKSKFTLWGIRGSIRYVPDFPFIYYPLHYRPESSTLTLGNGSDDESAIEFICRRLPFGLKLAVKENPSMIGDRRDSFYRNLNSMEGVVLIDPFVSTIELANKSIGVIGVSGTALLEAGLKGIPAHAVGEPEFKDFLTSNGWDAVERFLVDCVRGKAKPCKESLTRYLAFVLESKIDVELGWSSVSSKENVNAVSNKIAIGLQKALVP